MTSTRQLFLSHVAQTSDTPLMLEVDRAEGIYLFDKEGKKYIDLISGISVSNLGHCHPKVVAAVKEQAEKFMYLMVYGEYVYVPQVQFAKAITDHLPEKLESVYFVNSGAEATEGAMKLAKRYTGRKEIIYFQHAYHGNTQGAMSIMGDEYFKQAYRPLIPGNRMLEYGNGSQLDHITENTAAVFIEPVQAESGITVPSKSYMHALREKCTAVGALLVLDEIQTGLGRTGSLFAFQDLGIEPDILLLAKALGGGMPIGAFIAAKEVMDVFKDNPVLGHITTFGGHPVCCAAGMAGFEFLIESNLIGQVGKKEKLLLNRLKHPAIKQVRSKGLMMALEFESYEFNKAVIDECLAHGILVDWFLYASHCLRIGPPLIITEDELNKSCDILLQCIEKVYTSLS